MYLVAACSSPELLVYTVNHVRIYYVQQKKCELLVSLSTLSVKKIHTREFYISYQIDVEPVINACIPWVPIFLIIFI